jgi:hypothetical protein
VTTLSELMAPRLTRYIPHMPHEGPQQAFLWLNCKEALYGGAAGGGKSDALLMAALQYVDIPGYAAILFRRTYKDLANPGALLRRSKEWLAGMDAHWSEQDKIWTFPSGATVSFGHLEHPGDELEYQGAEFQFVGFDEASQFPEVQYEYLFSRLRRLEGSQVPVRMRAASNPGGPGHAWVKRRFIDRATRADRVFIPAKLSDNPSLDQQAYSESLDRLGEVLRKQLRDGDWDVRPLSGREFFEVEQMDEAEVWLRDPHRRGFYAQTGKVAKFTDNPAGVLAIYEPPKPDRKYLIGADVAGGISEEMQEARDNRERDSCGAYVCDAHNGRHVAELHLETAADTYARDLERLGRTYNNAEIAVEDNNQGLLTLGTLRDVCRYPNLFHREKLLYESPSETTKQIGWHTDVSTRPAMLAQLAAVLRDDPARLVSRALLAQMRTFVWNKAGTKAEADIGAHDDLVMAAAITSMLFLLRAQPPIPQVERKPQPKPKRVTERAPRLVGSR